MEKKALLDAQTLGVLQQAVEQLSQAFSYLPEGEPARADEEKMQQVMHQVMKRMADNYPYFHPLYAGQMLKPPHAIARLAYSLAMFINPNNHALDGGRASSKMEKEAVADIAAMFGWKEFLGHLCGGGTIANLEALWVAGRLAPGKKIVASGQAHYTHSRISGVLGIPFTAAPCDAKGRMDMKELERLLEAGDVGCVVATLGTTAIGSIDPLTEILALKEKYHFRLHADCAYGGYFTLANNLDAHARIAFDLLHLVDSIVIDPHKHGLQPYGCGCVLFRDPAVGKLYKHDSPYTYFSSSELHLGEISLECSRAGASAVALWATQKMFPLVAGGEFARGLSDCRTAALNLFQKLQADSRFVVPFAPELDIVVWAPRAKRVSDSSSLSRKIFEAAARRSLHLALATLPLDLFPVDAEMMRDAGAITCLRSVQMKPEHLAWGDRIFAILDEATAEATRVAGKA